MSFRDPKKKSTNGIDELIKKMEAQTKSKDGYKDDRFWRPEQDKTGNGFAIIRFLPGIESEDDPWVKIYNHAFQGPGGWYIENSLTTLGQKDPVGELNNQLWNSGLESDKDLARIRKRKLTYISNVYVVSDPANPQNEGKVFLYKYGTKIFEKIGEALKPQFNDEQPINPFDMGEDGANFRIKIRKVGGYTNYDKSEFDSPNPLFDDEEKMEQIKKSQHALLPFLAPENFKSYEELKTRMHEVLGGDVRATAPAQKTAEDVVDEMVEKKPSLKTKKRVEDDVDDETDALSYFQKLADN